MKTNLFVVPFFFFCAAAQSQSTAASTAPPSAITWSVAAQDGSSTTLVGTNYETTADGQVVPHAHKIVVAATGLNYPDLATGQWLPSKEEVDPCQGGAIAQHGQHKVFFADNLNTAGAIEVQMPGGAGELQASVLGLAYYDSASGRSVAFAQAKSSQGEIVGSNSVVYPDAFTGAVASVCYEYKKAGLEQSVLLEQQPPSPESFGLSSVSSDLQVITEFTGSATPNVRTNAAGGAVPDEEIDFGGMRFALAKAFLLGSNSDCAMESQQWVNLNGRSLLIESVPVRAIAKALEGLPAPAAITTRVGTPRKRQMIARAGGLSGLDGLLRQRRLPAHSAARAENQEMRLASKSEINNALDLDFDSIDTANGEGSWTFQSGTTYFISGPVYCTALTIQGSAILKFPNYTGTYPYNTVTFIQVLEGAPVNCQTSPLQPAVLTAADDNSIGQNVGDYWAPNGYIVSGGYANPAFQFEDYDHASLHDVRICYAAQAISAWSGDNVSLTNVQIVNCVNGVDLWTGDDEDYTNYGGPGISLQNCLIVSPDGSSWNAFSGGGGGYTTYYLVNCTLDNFPNLAWDGNDGSSGGNFYATNSVITDSALGGDGGMDGAGNLFYNASSGFGIDSQNDIDYPYATFGGGAYYPSLNPYFPYQTPPINLGSQTIDVTTNFAPQAFTNGIGYNYARIDYVVSGTTLNADVTFGPGTVVSWLGEGLELGTEGTVNFSGTATDPCYFVAADALQESDTSGDPEGMTGSSASGAPNVQSAFADFIAVDDNACYFYPNFLNVNAWSCEFYNGLLGGNTYGGLNLTLGNCLLDNSGIDYFTINTNANCSLMVTNCTLESGLLFIDRGSTNHWPIRIQNTAFDETYIAVDDPHGGGSFPNIAGNNNAYDFTGTEVPNDSVGVIPDDTNDVSLANYNWEIGPLGNFYLPTNSPLILKGSTNANLLGLYWYTTQTNETPETNAVVDIGYHFVATDTNGDPLENLGTNVPNYIAYPDGPPTNLVVFIFPTNESVAQGSNATFSAIATGTAPLTYQWYWGTNALTDGGGVSGSEGATLNLNGVNPDKAGNYYVVATNSFGSVTSTLAALTVQLLGTNAYDTLPLFIMPKYAYWNVTDISDPAQPVDIGELQEPYSTPSYTGNYGAAPETPENSPWHTNTTVTVTNAYGTTEFGGSNGVGTVYEIGITDTDFQILHTFSSQDGAYPSGQLAISGSTFYGISNFLYGTTRGGGSNGYGTVFKLNADGSGFTNLYQFTGANDGKKPQNGLLICGNTLYGTTTNTIFKINTDGSDFTCLKYITNASQLTLSLSGKALYGTTSNGADYGSIFSINTDGSGFTNLYTFTGGTNGGYPSSGLELYCIGDLLVNGITNFMLYGTTINGGAYGYGMVFSITNDGSGFTDLHDFNSNDGAFPIGGLVLTNDNVMGPGETYVESCLFGTTSSGGTNGGGTIFMINQVQRSPFIAFSNLYSFDAGARPEAKLGFCERAVCGTTSGGGANGYGMAFSLDCYGTNFTDLHDFGAGSDGRSPVSGLALPVVDNLGSIWSLETMINVSAANVSNLTYSVAVDDYYLIYVNGNPFIGTNVGGAQWSAYLPLTGLHQGENDVRVIIGGNCDNNDYFAMAVKSPETNILFGTANGGGRANDGTFFEIGPNGETNLYTFLGQDSYDGSGPVGDLVFSGSTLYGVTQYGGTNGYGEIFRINTNGLGYTNLYSFNGTPDGASPAAGLLLSGNTLYGTTEYGGLNIPNSASNNGTIFSIRTDGSGYTNLYSFAGGNDGQNPQASLLLISNTLYGTTEYGGAYDYNYGGTIFAISTNGIGYTNLYSFGATSSDGLNPLAPLVSVSNMLYGTTYYGGSNGYYGTIYRIGMNGSNYETVYSFTGSTNDGANPQASLTLLGSTLYGTTVKGGAYGDGGDGTIFSIGVNGSGYTNFLSFGSFDTEDGANPEANLKILDSALYGTTKIGGADSLGVVFSISTNGSSFNDIYDFMGSPNSDGANPEGGLCSP